MKIFWSQDSFGVWFFEVRISTMSKFSSFLLRLEILPLILTPTTCSPISE